jgi:hypothetical protein
VTFRSDVQALHPLGIVFRRDVRGDDVAARRERVHERAHDGRRLEFVGEEVQDRDQQRRYADVGADRPPLSVGQGRQESRPWAGCATANGPGRQLSTAIPMPVDSWW